MRQRGRGVVTGNVLETRTYRAIVHRFSEERVAAPFDAVDIDDDRPPPRFVYLDVEYRAKDVREIAFHSAFWRLVDVDGYRYEAATLASHLYDARDRPALDHGDLAPGDRVRGWLAFRPRPDVAVERVLVRTSALGGETHAIALADVPRFDPGTLI